VSEDITREGQADQEPNNPGDQAEKVFRQADVDDIVQRRLAEQTARLERKFAKERETLEAEWQTKLASSDEDISRRVEALLQEKLSQKELEQARASIVAEFGLNERQAQVLDGANAEELRQNAEALFGAIKVKTPPVIPTGGNQSDVSAGPRIYRRSELRDSTFFAQHRADIMAAMREGRITDD
jgi:hypothetical protein